MQSVLGGQEVTWVIPLYTEGGVVIPATAIEYRVIDQGEVEKVARTPLVGFTSGADSASVTVLAAANALAVQAGRELRMIELFVTTPDGTVKLQYSYVIEAELLLAIGVNSFQGYPSALMVGYELPAVDSWNTASKGDRINALIAAWRNISKLRLRDVEDESMSRIAPFNDIAEMTAAEFALLSADMRAALARAQVLEADYLLGGDEVGDVRRAGVMSMTVGESSNFFRPSKPYEAAVCKRAMKELSKYTVPGNARIARG